MNNVDLEIPESVSQKKKLLLLKQSLGIKSDNPEDSESDQENQLSFNDDPSSQEKEKEKADAEINRYWNDCNSDARWIGVFTLAVQVIIELKGMIWPNPKLTKQRQLAIIDFIISLVCFAGIMISFRMKYGIRYSYYPIVILILKIVKGVADFGQTK